VNVWGILCISRLFLKNSKINYYINFQLLWELMISDE
jgi:hypothetical protein